jgi:phosphoglycerate dehydrogenase-like enzyme
MGERVLVTEKEFRKGEALFRQAKDLEFQSVMEEEGALSAAVRATRTRAVIVGVLAYRKELYEALAETGRYAQGGAGGQANVEDRAPKALLARFGVGHNGIDKALARRHGIAVTITPGVLEQSVAELTLGLMLGLARRLGEGDAAFRRGVFSAPLGVELHGRVLGLVGLGAIGQRVARMAHDGLGLKILGCDNRPLEELARPAALSPGAFMEACRLEGFTREADEVLAKADVISLHLPLLPDTEHFLDGRRLRLLRPGALLINTARGALIDEGALYDALASGQLAGAALDVFEQEPYRPVSASKDLRTLSQVLLSSHNGSNTAEANGRMAASAIQNVRRFFAGAFAGLNRVDLPLVL